MISLSGLAHPKVGRVATLERVSWFNYTGYSNPSASTKVEAVHIDKVLGK